MYNQYINFNLNYYYEKNTIKLIVKIFNYSKI